VWACVAGGAACGGAAAKLSAFWSSRSELPLVAALCGDGGIVGVPRRGRHGGGGGCVLWGSSPWGRLSTPRRLLLRRCGPAKVSWRCSGSSSLSLAGVGGDDLGGRSGRCMAVAVWACGVRVEDLATSGEVVWRRPQIRSGWSLGQVPGRYSISVLRSSSMELVVAAAFQRLWARSSSAPCVRAPGGGLRRLRRWRLRAAEFLEVEDGGTQLCCPLYFPAFSLLVSDLVMFPY
jgi:hypothetical protein